jgi:hypothetical protein
MQDPLGRILAEVKAGGFKASVSKGSGRGREVDKRDLLLRRIVTDPEALITFAKTRGGRSPKPKPRTPTPNTQTPDANTRTPNPEADKPWVGGRGSC